MVTFQKLIRNAWQDFGNDATSYSASGIASLETLIIATATKIVWTSVNHNSSAQDAVFLVSLQGDQLVHDQDLGGQPGREGHDVTEVADVTVSRGRITVSFLNHFN